MGRDLDMIEVTDEMIYAFAGEPEITATDAHAIGVGLTAVLAIVERDYDVSPKLPQVEHRPKGDVWWNLSAETYMAECVCGEEFSGWPRSDAEERLLTHLEREARP